MIEGKKKRRRKVGMHKNRGMQTKQKESLVELDTEEDEVDEETPDGFFFLEGGGIPPNDLSDIYNFYKVPDRS